MQVPRQSEEEQIHAYVQVEMFTYAHFVLVHAHMRM